jgi:hypothetical protein
VIFVAADIRIDLPNGATSPIRKGRPYSRSDWGERDDVCLPANMSSRF